MDTQELLYHVKGKMVDAIRKTENAIAFRFQDGSILNISIDSDRYGEEHWLEFTIETPEDWEQ